MYNKFLKSHLAGVVLTDIIEANVQLSPPFYDNVNQWGVISHRQSKN